MGLVGLGGLVGFGVWSGSGRATSTLTVMERAVGRGLVVVWSGWRDLDLASGRAASTLIDRVGERVRPEWAARDRIPC